MSINIKRNIVVLKVGHWVSTNSLKSNTVAHLKDRASLGRLKAQAGHIWRLRSITPAWRRCHKGDRVTMFDCSVS